MTDADVLVIGAGPAGLAAATTAAEHGKQVLVLDDNLQPGGQIWRGSTLAGQHTPKAETPRQRALARLQRSGATLLQERRVFAAHRSGRVQALHESAGTMTAEEFRYKQLILATGAREGFLPFPGWTLPGVLGPGGLQALVRGGLPVAGKRIIVAGTGPLLVAVAAHLAEGGAKIVSIAEQAPLSRLALFGLSLWAQPRKLLQGLGYRMQLRGTGYRTGCWVTEAFASENGQQLRAVRFTDGTRAWEEDCDLLACGYHLVPNTEIAALLGCAFRGSFVQVNDRQRTSVPDVYCVGEPTGIAGLEAALAQGELAGLACAGAHVGSAQRRVAAERAFGEKLELAFALRDELRSLPRADTLVCRCEDVPFGLIRSQRDWTDSKLQTRCGMGACQGRICGPALQFLLDWKPVSVREPLFPVPLQAFCSPFPPSNPTKEKA